MVLIKANEESEAGAMPDEKFFADMNRFNQDLVKAGVMLDAQGLYPSAKGVRVSFSGDKVTVTDGPFAEAKELIAGFWLWQVKSIEEAVEWVKRIPKPAQAGDGEIEIRQVFDVDCKTDFTEEEANKKLEALRAQMDSIK